MASLRAPHHQATMTMIEDEDHDNKHEKRRKQSNRAATICVIALIVLFTSFLSLRRITKANRRIERQERKEYAEWLAKQLHFQAGDTVLHSQKGVKKLVRKRNNELVEEEHKQHKNTLLAEKAKRDKARDGGDPQADADERMRAKRSHFQHETRKVHEKIPEADIDPTEDEDIPDGDD
jgi:hypothetical protein